MIFAVLSNAPQDEYNVDEMQVAMLLSTINDPNVSIDQVYDARSSSCADFVVW